MGIIKRSSGMTAVSVSLPRGLLREIDRRAEALNLNRSQYLSFLARRDLEERGDLTITESQIPASSRPSFASAKGTERKILDAIKKDHEKAKAVLPVPPEAKP